LRRGCELFTALRNNRRVRLVTLLPVLLVLACGSSSGLQKNFIEGGPGQPITVNISGVDNSVELRDPDNSRRYDVQVEVGNSSDALVTVTQISIRTDGSGAFQVYPAVHAFNELIDPGKDHLFDVVVRGRFARPFAPDEAHTVVLRVIVTLSDGDAYAYSFEGPVRETP
jgi:hypothetical protein